MTENQIKIPVWFWIVAIILLIWNLMGVSAFFQHILISDEALQALPDNEKELYGKYPLWTKVAFAMAVMGGLLGSLALIMKKRVAKLLFMISFIGIVVQMVHSLFIAKAMDVYGPGALVMPIMVIVFGALAIRLSNVAIAKDWIK